MKSNGYNGLAVLTAAAVAAATLWLLFCGTESTVTVSTVISPIVSVPATSSVPVIFRSGSSVISTGSTEAVPAVVPAENEPSARVEKEPVMQEPPEQGAHDVIPGEYVFRFYNAADRVAFEEYVSRHGVTLLDSMAVGNMVRIRVADRRQLADLLRNAPVAVEHAPNLYVRIPERRELHRQAPAGGYTAFGAEAAKWLGAESSRGRGRGIKVAVLDSGVNAARGLSGRVVAKQYVDGSGESDGPHGSAVAGIIAGDASGMAPAADILSIRVLSDSGNGDTFTLAKAIVDAVDAGANIINMSLPMLI